MGESGALHAAPARYRQVPYSCPPAKASAVREISPDGFGKKARIACLHRAAALTRFPACS